MVAPSQRIKAAIIGYGESGKLSHAYGLQANPEFEIVAICDLSPECRDQGRAEIGCDTFASHQELLEAKPELDLACIVTRSDTHCPIACDFLEAKIPCVITKPWALNESEARSMLEAGEKNQTRIFPWFPMYWSPEYLLIRKLLEENAIGDVFMLRRHITQFRQRNDWQTESKFGGGYLLNWGPHIVQPLLSIIDSPVKSVFGKLQQVINPGDADDNFHAFLEFENGTVGIAEYTQAEDGLPSFMIQGNQGMIRSDGEKITLIQKDPSTDEKPTLENISIEGKRFGDEAHVYRDIAACLKNGDDYRVSPQVAYEGTIILDAIRESHLSNRKVEISEEYAMRNA